MEQHIDKIESYLTSLKAKPMPPNAAALDFRLKIDRFVDSFDLDLVYIDREGKQIKDDQHVLLHVIENGFEERLLERDFKDVIFAIFRKLHNDGHNHFPYPTFVTYIGDEAVRFHVQTGEITSVKNLE
ncbi:hypothetical protein [Lysinibacillus sp. 54212]|uniref:hypothetical protein n=1 Tax=Lysinibacillus sp. 54212 TaxID=3119829 RepID=UPI002FC834AF